MLTGAGRQGAGGDYTTGLVSMWDFNGNSADSIGAMNGADTAITYVPGKINQAASFAGAPSIITLPSSPYNAGNGNFSIFGWIKTAFASKDIMGFGRESLNTAIFFFVNASGKLAGDLYGTAGASSTVAVNDNQWHLVGLTVTAGSIQMFVDGAPSGAPVAKAPVIGPNYGQFGKTYSGSGNIFNGQMDKFRVFNRALSNADAAAMYAAEV